MSHTQILALLLWPFGVASAQIRCPAPLEPATLGTDSALLLPLANNDTVRLDYVVSETEIAYTYEGYLPEIDHHLVLATYWHGEGWRFLLFDHCTGTRTVLIHRPVVSPDAQRLAVASVDLEASYAPTVLEIWIRAGAGFQLEWKYEPLEHLDTEEALWGPGNARWVDSTAIAFDMVDDFGNVVGEGLAELAGGHWVLRIKR